MRRITAFLLASVIAAQAFYNVGVTGYWLVNRAKIAMTLCVNRARPDLHCDGKCFLEKKLAGSSDDSLPVPLKLKKGIEFEAFLPPPPIFSAHCFLPDAPDIIAGSQDLRHFSIENDIFHPPPFFGKA